MHTKISWHHLFSFIALLLLCIASNPGRAEVIDRIQINRAGNEAEIRIQFVARIQYLRQVMLKNGDVRIYFNLVEVDATDPKLVRQRKDSPPSSIVPRFTVTYPEIDSALTLSFGRPVDYHIRPGNDGRSISFFTPVTPGSAPETIKLPDSQAVIGVLPAEQAPITTLPSPRITANPELTELEAKQLMQDALNAQKRNMPLASIAILENLLALPPNTQSKAALAMRARAYENAKEFDKARLDYLEYMKRYPNSREYKQMEQGVARMIMAAYAEKRSMPEKQAVSDKMVTFGGFSQYYSKSLIKLDSIESATSVQTSTYSADKSELLSSLELTGVKTSPGRETRLVFRDTFTANFLQDAGNSNFLDAAYFEQAPADQRHYYGAGRKIGGSGGLPSRFDGAWLGSNLTEAWRLSTAIGHPVQPAGSDAEIKTFAAADIKLTRLPGQWSGDTYLIGRRIAGIIDSRAAGLEAHYYDEKRNHTVAVEYDTLFRKSSLGLIQTNWTTDGNDNYTLLLEHRRSMQLSNALNRQPPDIRIAKLLDAGVTQEWLSSSALVATPTLNQISIGMAHPYSVQLKLAGDFKFANTTSYEYYDAAKTMISTMPRVGAYTLSVHATGNNLLLENDLGTATASYTYATTYQSRSLTFNQVETFLKNWRLDLALELSSQHSDISGEFTRISPSMKLSYQRGSSMNFEFGAGFEQSHSVGTFLVDTTGIYQEQDNRSRRKYFNLGYRWDFR